MTRIRPQCFDANPSDRSAQADVLLREEPDEEEDEDEGDPQKMMTRMKTQTTAARSERALICVSGGRMTREEFVNVAEEALDSLPKEFRSRIQNVAILVEDFPTNQSPLQPGHQRRLLLGIFHGVPATEKSVFDVSMGPAHIVLYQKNIEAISASEAEVRHQIRQTLIHELGHYFGMTEEQLKDV